MKTSLKIKKIRKKIKNKYKTVIGIDKRLGEIINQELDRGLNKKEELEFIELKKIRESFKPK